MPAAGMSLSSSASQDSSGLAVAEALAVQHLAQGLRGNLEHRSEVECAALECGAIEIAGRVPD
jgi:hypothetical protein